jgi:hypothetical protein
VSDTEQRRAIEILVSDESRIVVTALWIYEAVGLRLALHVPVESSQFDERAMPTITRGPRFGFNSCIVRLQVWGKRAEAGVCISTPLALSCCDELLNIV